MVEKFWLIASPFKGIKSDRDMARKPHYSNQESDVRIEMFLESIEYSSYLTHIYSFFSSSLLPVACCLKIANISQLKPYCYISN